VLVAPVAVAPSAGAARPHETTVTCPDGTTITVNPDTPSIDFAAPKVDVSVVSSCGGIRMTAQVDGVKRIHTFFRTGIDDTEEAWAFDPCGGARGSDLPGARVELRAWNGEREAIETMTLGPDDRKPRVRVDSSPAPGSRVEPGDRISFEATATDTPQAGRAWQTGVHTLQVTGPQGLVADDDAGNQPKPCSRRSNSLVVEDTYRVRRSDPPVIELCAVAEDYVPNDQTKCVRYYQGEVWEGEAHGWVQTPTCSRATQDGPVTLVVDDDGNVSGTGTTNAGAYTCEGAGLPAVSIPAASIDYPVSGTKTRREFRLDGTLPVLRIDGDRATGTQALPAGAAGKITVTLRCRTC
jgi:hypothetical protein